MSKSFVKLKYLALTKHQTQRKRNMEKPKKLQTLQRQFEILVDVMVQHSDLAKGELQCGNAKQRTNNLWTKLTDDLNSYGPPVRDVASWKKVWSDLKTHTKVKMRKNKMSISSTDGGVSQYCPLFSMEEHILNLLHMEEVLLSSQNKNSILNEPAPAAKRSCFDKSFQTDVPHVHFLPQTITPPNPSPFIFCY